MFKILNFIKGEEREFNLENIQVHYVSFCDISIVSVKAVDIMALNENGAIRTDNKHAFREMDQAHFKPHLTRGLGTETDMSCRIVNTFASFSLFPGLLY